jgi:hypothetical protein
MPNLSLNFEPYIVLRQACYAGAQISSNELLVYEQACEYFGEDRVALQTTEVSVEGTLPTQSASRRAEIARIDLLGSRKSNLTTESLGFEEALSYVETYYNTIYSLYIYWPEVKVTNENDKSVTIQDVFVRIKTSVEGLPFREPEPFTVLKTSFSKLQWNHRYIHSHVRQYSSFGFKHMCLGTGPIKRTISKLQVFPNDVLALKLFFWELDKVMHVESLAGVPYIRLTSIQENTTSPITAVMNHNYEWLNAAIQNGGTKTAIYKFLSSFVKAVEIPTVFVDGKYTLACSFIDFAILLTNYHNKWFRTWEKAEMRGIKIPTHIGSVPMQPYVIKDGKLYDYYQVQTHLMREADKDKVFTFKGQDFKLKIVDGALEDTSPIYLIDVGIVASVIDFILKAINMAVTADYEQKEQKGKDKIDYEQSRALLSSESFRERHAWATGSTPAID